MGAMEWGGIESELLGLIGVSVSCAAGVESDAVKTSGVVAGTDTRLLGALALEPDADVDPLNSCIRLLSEASTEYRFG